MLHADGDVLLCGKLACDVWISPTLLFILLCVPVNANLDPTFGGVSYCVGKDVVCKGVHRNVKVGVGGSTIERLYVQTLNVGVGAVGERAGWCCDRRRNGFAQLGQMHRCERWR